MSSCTLLLPAVWSPTTTICGRCLSGLYGVLVVSSAIAAAVEDLLLTEEADIVANEVGKWSTEEWKVVGVGWSVCECVND